MSKAKQHAQRPKGKLCVALAKPRGKRVCKALHHSELDLVALRSIRARWQRRDARSERGVEGAAHAVKECVIACAEHATEQLNCADSHGNARWLRRISKELEKDRIN
jgi:hypothetical protein